MKVGNKGLGIAGLFILILGGYLLSTSSSVVYGSVVPSQNAFKTPLTVVAGGCTLTWTTPPIITLLNGPGPYGEGQQIAVYGNLNAQTSGTCDPSQWEILSDWIQQNPASGQNPTYAVFAVSLASFSLPFEFSFQAPTSPGTYSLSVQAEPTTAGASSCNTSSGGGCPTAGATFSVSSSTSTTSVTTTATTTATTISASGLKFNLTNQFLAGIAATITGLAVMIFGFTSRRRL